MREIFLISRNSIQRETQRIVRYRERFKVKGNTVIELMQLVAIALLSSGSSSSSSCSSSSR